MTVKEIENCDHEDIEYRDNYIHGENRTEEFECLNCGAFINHELAVVKKYVELPNGETKALTEVNE